MIHLSRKTNHFKFTKVRDFTVVYNSLSRTAPIILFPALTYNTNLLMPVMFIFYDSGSI